jgi:hypothetical protein
MFGVSVLHVAYTAPSLGMVTRALQTRHGWYESWGVPHHKHESRDRLLKLSVMSLFIPEVVNHCCHVRALNMAGKVALGAAAVNVSDRIDRLPLFKFGTACSGKPAAG